MRRSEQIGLAGCFRFRRATQELGVACLLTGGFTP
jgi:hypothetical protein